jgi:hypothetical protein
VIQDERALAGDQCIGASPGEQQPGNLVECGSDRGKDTDDGLSALLGHKFTVPAALRRNDA